MGHHYVPRFLLRQWLSGDESDKQLLGHYWDRYSGNMRIRRRGENFFCNRANLFTVRGLPDGDDAIERLFFKKVDDQGALAYRKVLDGSPLSIEDRTRFITFVLSLEARRPAAVEYVKSRASTFITEKVNSDPDIRRVLDEAGITRSAAEVWEEYEGFSIADQAMETVQKLSINQRVGGALLRASWGTFRVQPDCDDLVLGDRPLIRFGELFSPQNIWVLPLTPKAAWFCALDPRTYRSIGLMQPRKFAAWINTSAALTSDKYVFCQRPPTTTWLEKRLKARDTQLADGSSLPYNV
ncbi:MAG: DUF4238 domain-containing protein [Devosia sp.]